ncbi:MAG: D-alanine--D-alanine ligase [Gammaproteobacteria bacterium]
MNNNFGKVLVLMGGWSNEREISLISGKYVYDSLISSGINAIKLDLKKNNLDSIKSINPDRVFIILHGKGGEDGEIQSYLDKLGIPYTGSNSLSSSICMNKRLTKDILKDNGIFTPDFIKIDNNVSDNIEEINFEYPYVIKPSSEGSSIGVHIVEDKESYKLAINENKIISKDFIAEKYVAGEEYTVGIIENKALPIIKLEPPGKFYDYNAKYNSENMRYICPSGLEKDLEEEIKTLSVKTFNALKCHGWGRVDLIVDNNKKPWVIEINTVPGMTEHSLLPMAAKQVNINFDDLVIKILNTSV